MTAGSRSDAFVGCRVESRRWLAEDLALVGLEPPRRLAAGAGQFAMVRGRSWGEAPLLPRPMSLLSAGDRLELLIRRCGAGTELLTSADEGDVIDVLAPLGRGFGEPRAGRVLIVAGGCGLAPTLFAARELVRSGATRPRFLYGARTASELVLRDEVAAVSDLETATDDGSEGHPGLVTDLLARVLPGAGDVEVWACGPEAMMAETARLAALHGARCLVSVEERMACGRGLCLGCARIDLTGVPRYVCLEGPVFDAAELYEGRRG